MRMTFLLIWAAIIGSSSVMVHAATTRVLLPVVVTTPVPGAYGSLWKTRVTILNSGSAPLDVIGVGTPCIFDPCVRALIPPQQTMDVEPYVPRALPGRFLIVDEQELASLRVQLRVQDLSRQSDSWGTDVPVIEENAASAATLNLLSIPSDPAQRPLLRIYDFDSAAGHVVAVRTFRRVSNEEDVLLSERLVALAASGSPDEYPGYIQVPLEVSAGGTDLRVSVTPTGTPFRIWAFISVTNNVTQQITLVTPQPR